MYLLADNNTGYELPDIVPSALDAVSALYIAITNDDNTYGSQVYITHQPGETFVTLVDADYPDQAVASYVEHST